MVFILVIPLVLYPVEWAETLRSNSWGYNMSRAYSVFLAATLLQKFCYARIHEGVSVKVAKNHQANRFWNTPRQYPPSPHISFPHWRLTNLFYATVNAARIIRSWIPGNIVSFEITGTVVSSINERSATLRKPLWTRLLNSMILMYAGWIFYAVMLLLWRCAAYATTTKRELIPPSPAALVFLFSSVMKLSIPVQYMAWPPTVPERRELLKKDADGVYRADRKSEAEPRAKNKMGWKDGVELTIIIYGIWRTC